MTGVAAVVSMSQEMTGRGEAERGEWRMENGELRMRRIRRTRGMREKERPDAAW
jgi:hypothetical protein